MSKDSYTFQFAYDASSTEGYSSSLLSARRPGPDPHELLKSASLPNLGITSVTPQMPPKGHKAHKNNLQSHYDPARVLQAIVRLKQTAFHLDVRDYIDSVPTESACGAPPMAANIHPSGLVTCLSDLSRWVYLYGLLPVQQAFHQTYPMMQNYQWLSTDNRDERDLDRKLIRMYHWNTLDKIEVDGALEVSAPAMIMFVQEPWVLSDKDFTNFVRTKSMPQVPRQLTGNERLWAKIYDECLKSNCRWFAITTYHKWSFGVFSEGFQAAFITFELPCSKPYLPYITPLQTLYYWIASSMDQPGTFVPARMMETQGQPPAIIRRSHQYRRRNRNRNGEWLPVPVFQHSESEMSSDSENDDDVKSNYSCFSQRPPESEMSYQSNNNTTSSLATDFLHAHAPIKGHLPVAGDQLTKEATLPRRHWRTDEQAEKLERARALLQANRTRNDTLDWLDEGEFDRWDDGGGYGAPVPAAPRGVGGGGGANSSTAGTGTGGVPAEDITVTMRKMHLRQHWVNATGEPPSPAFSDVSRDGSAVGGMRGGMVGHAMFTVAPKQLRRHIAYQP